MATFLANKGAAASQINNVYLKNDNYFV